MRVLVIGADGFVGRHLERFLSGAGDDVLSIYGPQTGSGPQDDRVVDVRDGAAVHRAVERARPDAIVHLAAVSSVAHSHAEPELTFHVNALGALHACMALKACAPGARLLLVASGEVYGSVAPGRRATEHDSLAPLSPYAASKLAAEAIGLQFARSYGLSIVSARSFNHLGPGQAPAFVAPSFARQVELARRGGDSTISVGNLQPVRDFLHVQDVVRAYRLLLERGKAGEAYNVCSGEGRSIQSLLDELAKLAGIEVHAQVDPARFRPSDIPYLVGDAAKLKALGWAPTHTVTDALRAVLDEAREALG